MIIKNKGIEGKSDLKEVSETLNNLLLKKKGNAEKKRVKAVTLD